MYDMGEGNVWGGDFIHHSDREIPDAFVDFTYPSVYGASVGFVDSPPLISSFCTQDSIHGDIGRIDIKSIGFGLSNVPDVDSV